ncbi:TPA: Rpn family recombination-promoting nuclease/putative transposase, partial [Providencia alcalifaciens]
LQEKGRQEGLQQGFEKGIEKGREEERVLAYQRQLNMARNLLKNGVSLELIVESTGLSREELISLQ